VAQVAEATTSSGVDSMRYGGHVPPLLQMAGHGGTMSRRTARNWPNCTDLSRKRSPKSGRTRPKKISYLTRAGSKSQSDPCHWHKINI